jgi:hypothetical protein
LLPAEIARAVDWSTLRPDTREVPAKIRASTHTELAFVARLEEAAHPVEVVRYVLIGIRERPTRRCPCGRLQPCPFWTSSRVSHHPVGS